MNHRTLAAEAGMLLAALMLAASAAFPPGAAAAEAAEAAATAKLSAKEKEKPAAQVQGVNKNMNSRAASKFVSVVKDGVNLRSEPSTDTAVRFELPEGYPLEVLERKDDWIRVRDYEGDTGWISANLVADAAYVIVKSAKGNIRSGPGTEYDPIGKVVRDVILKKIEEKDGWIKVSHPQLTGWLAKQLVWP